MKTKLTKEIVNERIKDSGIYMIGEYTNSYTKSLFTCSKGHEWKVRPKSVLSGDGCPHCVSKSTLTKEIVNERIADRGIYMIGEYTNSYTKSLFTCSKGHEWKSRPKSVLSGDGCPHCASKFPLTKEIVNERIKDSGIYMIGEYTNSYTKSLLKCSKGHEWESRPKSVLSGAGCPHCSSSGFKSANSGVLYVLHYKKLHCIKYGITNNFNERYQKLSRQSDCDVLHTINFEYGGDALLIENQIKKSFGGRHVSKKQLPDGYTETLPESMKDELLTILKGF